MDTLVPSNDYNERATVLYESIYPNPSPGYERRIWVLMMICAFLGLMSILYLWVYGKSTKLSDRKFWIWRICNTADGRYIVPNIYVCTTSPFILTAPLVALLLNNERRVFAHHASQHGLYIWRNCTWLPIFWQGHSACCAALVATIMTSTAKKHWLFRPVTFNTLYLGVPFFSTLVAVILGVIVSKDWDKYVDITLDMVELLRQAGKNSSSGGFVNPSLEETLASLSQARASARARFDQDYLGWLILWPIGAVLQICFGVGGLMLISKLVIQLQYMKSGVLSNRRRSTFAGIHDDIEKINSGPISPRTRRISTFEPPKDKSISFLPCDDAANDIVGVCSVPLRCGREGDVLAMKKLILVLGLGLLPVVMCTVIFGVDAIYLAARMSEIQSNWSTTEKLTGIRAWSYLLGSSGVITIVLCTEFLYLHLMKRPLGQQSKLASPSFVFTTNQPKPIPTGATKFPTRPPLKPHASQTFTVGGDGLIEHPRSSIDYSAGHRKISLGQSVEVTTVQEIQVDLPDPEANRHQEWKNRLPRERIAVTAPSVAVTSSEEEESFPRLSLDRQRSESFIS